MSAPNSGRPPLDGVAGEAIAAARARAGLGGRRRPPAPAPTPRTLTDQERRDAQELIRSGQVCRCCAGLHPGGEVACPRLASFELDGDGRLRSGAYWPDGEWDASRVVFAAEVPDVKGGGDGP